MMKITDIPARYKTVMVLLYCITIIKGKGHSISDDINDKVDGQGGHGL